MLYDTAPLFFRKGGGGGRPMRLGDPMVCKLKKSLSILLVIRLNNFAQYILEDFLKFP